MAEIQDIIREFISLRLNEEEIYSVIGTASNIDTTERTCDVAPIDGTADILGVKLQSIINGTKGFVQIPKANSKVVVTFLNKQTGYVALCEEVDKILITTDLVEFNGGTLDGMVKINDLTTKLNALITEIKALKTWANAHVHGAAGTSPVTPFAGTFTNFNKNDYENTKITQ